jgi:hypothetical protein
VHQTTSNTFEPAAYRSKPDGAAGPPTDPTAEPTAPLRAAAKTLTMHATIHDGIADLEQTLHNDGEPDELFDDILARIASLAPRHRAVADAARDVAAALRAIVAAIDQAIDQAIDHTIAEALADPTDTPAHCEGTAPAVDDTLTALYRDARRQVRTHWAYLTEFHQVLVELHLVETEPTSTPDHRRC